MSEQPTDATTRMQGSPLFPFDGDLTLRTLSPLIDHELVREGEGGRPCRSCDSDDRTLWSNERWKLTWMSPTANPVGLFLETVEHIDFEHFDDDLASDYGLLTVRLESAIRSLDSVGRVHIHRWGDGSSHFHVWFQGRPARRLELYGWGNVLWSQLAEPLPHTEVQANHAAVVEQLCASVGGNAHTA